MCKLLQAIIINIIDAQLTGKLRENPRGTEPNGFKYLIYNPEVYAHITEQRTDRLVEKKQPERDIE